MWYIKHYITDIGGLIGGRTRNRLQKNNNDSRRW
jgi:hypothetical protein